jgi:hypothetical protein
LPWSVFSRHQFIKTAPGDRGAKGPLLDERADVEASSVSKNTMTQTRRFIRRDGAAIKSQRASPGSDRAENREFV